MAHVKLVGVMKKYEDKQGGVVAVNDFNLDIDDKEFIILVGPSGCGKTTTLRMVAGLEEITEGEIFIDGKLVNDVQPKDRDIAMVFQNYALYPHMTVFENMAFGLKLRKTPKEEINKQVHEAAKILEIEHLLDRRPKALSGGQRQRVALGRAIVRHPKVFLMDEPLSNLDAKLRVQMRIEISKLHKRLQTTIVYVTHDQTEAMTMGTRIVVMKDGIIQQVDSPQALYDRPVNMFVAGFIGSPQMNFVNVVLEKDGEDVYMIYDKNRIRLVPDKAVAIANTDYIGKEVTMGIRPENFLIEDEDLENFSDAIITANVEVVENLGSEALVYLKSGDTYFTARVKPGVKLIPDEEIKVALDTNKVHIFDKETEAVIVQ